MKYITTGYPSAEIFWQNMLVEASALLGERLRSRRAELGLTLAAVATEAGLSVPYVANLEKGRGNPTLDAIVGLASALRVPPPALLGGRESTLAVDVAIASLPSQLIDFSRSRDFIALTRRLAQTEQVKSSEIRAAILRALAETPRPRRRDLTARDYQRLVDAFTLILGEPGEPT